ncbi:hypothetical protein ULMS_16910 [Patiriisocius marinistellae]|uniref:Uncharacterized protein n=1 Tax=Patiriisocius marinistellae TaxID=2494560 RepID=A0A5J4FW74_9FLAO|nr:sensor histidine kinase [Patiriisocius marinistellae]GEQ86183.1 hypothetical protein ULMS_16910 [Patiriisocius marinistellae]
MSKEEILLITYVIAVLLGFTVFTIFFITAFQKKKNKFLVEKVNAQQRFDKEIETSRLEIQEQTLKNVAWELHDNIGQLLSVANMQLNLLSMKAPQENKYSLEEASQTIKQTLNEVRLLSKTLNSDVILKNGLVDSIKNELSRFDRMKFLNTTLKIDGDVIVLESDKEILIFRIFQEFCTNVLKHAKASVLSVRIAYEESYVTITMDDDGVGYDDKVKSRSNGLETMKGRANLLNSEFKITSTPNKGTSLFLKSPYNDLTKTN